MKQNKMCISKIKHDRCTPEKDAARDLRALQEYLGHKKLHPPRDLQ